MENVAPLPQGNIQALTNTQSPPLTFAATFRTLEIIATHDVAWESQCGISTLMKAAILALIFSSDLWSENTVHKQRICSREVSSENAGALVEGVLQGSCLFIEEWNALEFCIGLTAHTTNMVFFKRDKLFLKASEGSRFDALSVKAASFLHSKTS